MTPADEHEREPGGEDLLAAEYVLGVLSADERQAVVRRIESDPNFARLAERWEARLDPLASDYAEAAPPPSVKDALDRMLFPGTAQSAPVKPGPWQSLVFWRGLAAAALVALVLLVAVPLVRPPVGDAPTVRFVASLAADGSDVSYLALYDAAHGRVGLSHLSGDREPGQDFELWIIEGGDPPLSLGVIPVGQTVQLVLTQDAREKFAQGAVFAISLEPAGGSPTGQPTGPVVAAGEIRKI